METSEVDWNLNADEIFSGWAVWLSDRAMEGTLSYFIAAKRGQLSPVRYRRVQLSFGDVAGSKLGHLGHRAMNNREAVRP